MHQDGCDVGAPWLPWLWRDRPVALTVVKRYVPDERSVTRSPARARRTVNTAGANTAEFTALRPRTRLAHLRDRGLSAEQLTRLRRGARCGGGPLPQGLSRVCLIAAIGLRVPRWLSWSSAPERIFCWVPPGYWDLRTARHQAC